MFGLSFTHLVLFGIIALIFIGPEQLPEVARTIARLLNELRRATQDFQSQFTGDIRNQTQDIQALLKDANPMAPLNPQPPAHAQQAPPHPPEAPTGHGPEAHQGHAPAELSEEKLPEGAHPVSEEVKKS